MKQGLTLTELATEIQRRQETKKDYIVSPSAMRMIGGGEKPQLSFGPNVVGINDLAHEQVGNWLEIPRKYYDRMLAEKPALLAENVNGWLAGRSDKRMIRTLDGNARALVSDKFRARDDYDLAQAVLPVLGQLDVQIMSCDVTEKKLYIKAVDNRITKDLRPGTALGRGHDRFDTLSPAIVISNSEVGCGATAVETGVWTSGCTNLLVVQQRSVRKYHVGARVDIGDEVYAMLTDTTKQLTDTALFAQLRDVVAAAFDRAKFDALVNDLQATAEEKITGDVPTVVEVAAKKFGLNETERQGVLRHLIEGGDLTRYGLFNAVTRMAQDVPSYDRASELERVGGQIVELKRDEFERLAA